jgi:nucleotide-binding universal stress UspA family protein
MTGSLIKSIFLPVCVRDDGLLPACIPYALELADSYGAHVEARAIGMRFGSPGSFSQGFVDSIVGGANKQELAKAEALEGLIRAKIAASKAKASLSVLHEHVEDLMPIIAAEARLSDLCVLPSANSAMAYGRSVIEECLFHSGRPSLIVPDGAERFSCARIAIAWDGSQRAARAMHDAMPFLLRASSAEIITVTNEKVKTKPRQGSAVQRYLERHGIVARVVELSPEDRDAARAVKTHVKDTGADLLVMGGYVHSWLRQMIFGGVTESMLEAPPAPLLMSL